MMFQLSFLFTLYFIMKSLCGGGHFWPSGTIGLINKCFRKNDLDTKRGKVNLDLAVLSLWRMLSFSSCC